MFKLRNIKKRPAKRFAAKPDQSQSDAFLVQTCSQLIEAINSFVESNATLEIELSAAAHNASSGGISPTASLAADVAWFARTTSNELASVLVKASPANHAEAQARINALIAYVTTHNFDEHIQSVCYDTLATERIIFGKNTKLLQHLSLAEAIKLWLHAERLPARMRPAVASHEPVRHPNPLA